MFSYDFAAGEKRAMFTLETVATATPPEAPCAYARLVPERFDDMAWENDRIAHRMYGFALNTPAAGGERLRGSGIDVWGKRVTYPIIDRWYAKGHDQFHKDGEGEGLDLYSIGGSRGAGGTGVWDGTKLWTSDNFVDRAGAVERPAPCGVQTQLRALRTPARGGSVAETKQFTVDCGRNFDAVESVFDFAADEAVVGIGITEHPAVEGFPAAVLTQDPARPLDELLGREQGRRARRRGDPRERRDTRPASRTNAPAQATGQRQPPAAGEGAETACRCAISPAPAGRRAGSSMDRAAWETLREGVRRAQRPKPSSVTVSAANEVR